VGSERAEVFGGYRDALAEATMRARAETITPTALQELGATVRQDGVVRSVFDLLGHGSVSREMLFGRFAWLQDLAPRVLEQLGNTAVYSGYISRQEAEIRGFRREEALTLEDDLDFAAVGGLSTELREKLRAARPQSLGAASRIQGMTPAALAALSAHVRKRPKASVEECFT